MSAPDLSAPLLAAELDHFRCVLAVIIERGGGVLVIPRGELERVKQLTLSSRLSPDGSLTVCAVAPADPEPIPLEQAADALRAANREMDGTEHPAIYKLGLAIDALLKHVRLLPVPAATAEEPK